AADSAASLCRAAVTDCHPAETSPDATTTSPTNVVKAAGTACTDDGNPCTTDTCNGSTSAPACTHPAGNAGTVCRAAVNECDTAETCTGTSTIHPTEVVKATGTPYKDDGHPCT